MRFVCCKLFRLISLSFKFFYQCFFHLHFSYLLLQLQYFPIAIIRLFFSSDQSQPGNHFSIKKKKKVISKVILWFFLLFQNLMVFANCSNWNYFITDVYFYQIVFTLQIQSEIKSSVLQFCSSFRKMEIISTNSFKQRLQNVTPKKCFLICFEEKFFVNFLQVLNL